MNPARSKLKLALLTNMIAPYRLPLYSILANEFDLLVLYGGKEANRDSWDAYEKSIPNARAIRAWGWQIRYTTKLKRKAFDEKFIHLTPGYLWHLLRFRPDALISNEMGFRSMVAVAYGMLCRKPVWIWWEGTLHSERNIGPVRKMLRRAFVLLARRWVTFGQNATAYLLNLGVKPDRVLESQNAVDEQRFQSAVAPAWDLPQKPVVLYVGQLIERKGVDLLLEAAATLQRLGYEFSLLLVGNGRDKLALERRAQALALKNVYFESAQTPEKMPAVYRSGDLLVLPTLEDVWGLVANEAILSGLPVLCSKYAGCASELFAPENIVSPDDREEFVEKLRLGVSGNLSRADRARLRAMPDLGKELVFDLNVVLAHSSPPAFPASAESSP